MRSALLHGTLHDNNSLDVHVNGWQHGKEAGSVAMCCGDNMSGSSRDFHQAQAFASDFGISYRLIRNPCWRDTA